MMIIYNETRFSDFSFRYKWFSPFQIPCIVVLVTDPSVDYENILEHMEQLQE